MCGHSNFPDSASGVVYSAKTDAGGELYKQSYSDGTKNVHEYYENGKLSSLTRQNTDGSNQYVVDYFYDAFGRKQQVSYQNGITGSYQYDLDNRLSNLAWVNGTTPMVSEALTYDLVGAEKKILLPPFVGDT